jgi:P-aminobenzoate N-oxygenase AurF
VARVDSESSDPDGGHARPSAFRVARVFPDLPDDLLLNLFHKGVKVQWTSRNLDWESPVVMSERKRQALAHLLTPVYFGEQTAMAGAANIMPRLMLAGETTAALYVSSFIMDEARHFEALTRLYRKLGFEPTNLRRIPELLRYHHRIRQGDRADWVWGILFSDVIAKHFYRSFGLAQQDPLFGEMSKQILKDESRHLAFADHYLRKNVPKMDAARRRALVDMKSDLFRILTAMTERVRADAAEFEVDADAYLEGVGQEVEKFGRRIGLSGGDDAEPPDDRPPATPAAEAPSPDAPPKSSSTRTPTIKLQSVTAEVARCFGCLLISLCNRLAPA